MSKTRFDHLALANVSPKRVARATFRALDRIQEYEPHEQCAAAAALFIVVCETCKADPQDVMTATRNLLMDEREGRRQEFQALRMYAENEI